MRPRHLLGVTTALLLGAFASCKEPTQVTLSISTDTLCKSETFDAPRLNDVAIVAAAKLDPKSLVPTGTTESCEPPKARSAPDSAAYVGSLVLVPDADRTGSQIDVLVVAGVENDNPKAVDQSKSMSAAACLDLLAAGTPISGTACIVARRNVGFVDNLPLVLPIELERDCIGKECGEDQTCFHGNCVSSTLDCAGATSSSPDCTPKGCAQSCDDGCLSKSGDCEAGSCTCASCDATKCAESCGFEGKDGACSADGTECRCQELCDPGSCTMFCGGDCSPGQAECVCPTCDAVACAMTMCGNGQTATCSPTCQCSGTSCADVTLQCATGQTQEQVGDACVCTCNQAACDLDCAAVGSSGGMCNADESCSCLPACPEPPSCTTEWATPTGECVDGGWVCACDEASCDTFCGPSNVGACTSPTQCDCSPIGGTGGGGAGAGNQGAGGTGAGQGVGGSGAGNQGAGGTGAGQGVGGSGGGGGNCGYVSACLDPGLCSSTNCNGYAGAGADCDANCNCQNCISDGYCDCDCKLRGAPLGGSCALAIAGGPDCICACSAPTDCAGVCGSGKTGTCTNGECICNNGAQFCVSGMHGSFTDLGSCQQACTQGLCPNCLNNSCVQYANNPPMFTCICQP